MLIDKDITQNKFLKEVEKIKLKDYELIKTKENFFIWKRLNKSDYIRLCLIWKNYPHNKEVFYWNLELSFKPMRYKHNHRENANIRSLTFKNNDTKLFFKYFLKMISKIKGSDIKC